MGNLSLEIFDLPTQQNPSPTTSKYAWLEDDASITITDTSEIFASGDVWSHSFTLNVGANAHIFGSAGEVHGSRLHDVINKRRARLWVMGLPLYLGYLKLDDEAEVNEDGDVEVSFESGQKTFDELIADTKAREVSVGDVVIGVALNRKRVVLGGTWRFDTFILDGLTAYAAKDQNLNGADGAYVLQGECPGITPYMQRWPKLVKSHGKIYNSSWGVDSKTDYTNVQSAYDAAHPFCNINICYPLKANKDGEEVAGRGYTLRLARGHETTDGGDNQTRYNNAPNFYLLYFIDRLFNDLKIHVAENQALGVEDLRRVFMLNYGCHYEEIEDTYKDSEINNHTTPSDKLSRYGQYYIPFVDKGSELYLVKDFEAASKGIHRDDYAGKVLIRDVQVSKNGADLLSVGSVEGKIGSYTKYGLSLDKTSGEEQNGAYSAYLAYATGDNYPDVEIKEIIEAMKSMFGIRLIFDADYNQVRIVLLRNVFNSSEVQSIDCEILDKDVKVDNCIRGFRMTYGKGTENTAFYYKGFNDLFPRASKTWKDTTDKHDYSLWDLDADYDFIKQQSSAFNRRCYVTPVNGNAYGTQVDEDEDVLFPSVFEWAGYMDAEDGDCSGEENTIEEIQCGATPVIMNEVGTAYASLFSGDLKAPTPDNFTETTATRIATFGRMTPESLNTQVSGGSNEDNIFTVKGRFDVFISEGFEIRMKDNYAISNGGTPFDEASPGLQFGIMRGSGGNAIVGYYPDEEENENPLNDYWEIIPGDGAIDHPDTCDNYGNQWVYSAAGRSCDASLLRAAGWPVSGSGEQTCTYNYAIGNVNILCTPIKYVRPGGRPPIDPVLTKSQLEQYVSGLWNEYSWKFANYDIWKLILSANGNTVFGDGRFSLKLRAEKLNPYYDPNKPEGEKTISTKAEAAAAMTSTFTTANTDLLNRPKVPNATMRAAGWNAPGDGYATVYSIGIGVMDNNGAVHELLWTPILADGQVMTEAELRTYIGTFEGMSMSSLKTQEARYNKLLLDIDTTEQRAILLHELQAIYYAEDGETVDPIVIPGTNTKYLTITNESLRHRGLADQFYKEYSYWVRNARIVKRTVRMEIAQFLSIDKTKRVKVGDVTGFIRKMQFSVSNKTGLSMVEMEILYI